MAFKGAGGRPGPAPASPASSSVRSSVIPPNASSMTYPVTPRSNMPAYIRRSSTALQGPNAVGSPLASSASVRSSTLPPTPGTSGVSAANAGTPFSSLAAIQAGPDILERSRDRTKNNEVSSSALAFLFAEIVGYTQNRVSGISDLERKLSLMGYRVGQRVLPLLSHRIEFPTPPSLSSGSSTYNRTPKREIRLLPVLLWLHTQLWKALFGRAADSLERSTEKSDEYMISTNTPLLCSIHVRTEGDEPIERGGLYSGHHRGGTGRSWIRKFRQRQAWQLYLNILLITAGPCDRAQRGHCRTSTTHHYPS
ncbi:hypothetical protein IEQ34_025534 [Dendrobium chrysotoxum]|uniref:Trafficking protein particle complex subunit n=1 Tax=Dendrobium chrysotoxum TaxID=161865 RepID=A0AAV7FPL7_DENCH|nr:hypothetical protein IEQ34_025534 [Dendrobium chrysotoxum]